MWNVALAGIMLGAAIGVFFCASLIDKKNQEIRELKRKLRAYHVRYEAERGKRLDRENDLEDAQEIIIYQRDALYNAKPKEYRHYIEAGE